MRKRKKRFQKTTLITSDRSVTLPLKTVLPEPGRVIRERREALGMKGVELAKRSKVKPQTLHAIETGRIRNPSISFLEPVAEVLGVSVASFFLVPGDRSGNVFATGGQKGHYVLDFSRRGFRVVSHTPLNADFFVGKIIVNSETKIDHKAVPTRGMVFAQAIIGRLGIHFEGEDYVIKEGHSVFFNGSFSHFFFNPRFQESTFLLVSAPSFAKPGDLIKQVSEMPITK